ncbi:MAG: N-6 DNA methylase [Candidatus Thorarchaeota archaeon]
MMNELFELMGSEKFDFKEKMYRRKFGSHITSAEIFEKFIFPEIKHSLDKYLWVDLFAGEGNLILPILKHISLEKREDFFKNQIFLFDVQEDMVKKCVENAQLYSISEELAKKNIQLRDNLKDFPKVLLSQKLPVYHITNPPYLYLGYIRKHENTQKYLELFKGKNEGYQDLYQIAMMNDLRSGIEHLIYIIPTNFLFGASVSNKFRRDFLSHYIINNTIIFETQIFEFTGTNICITFLKKKKLPIDEIFSFRGVKIKQGNKVLEKEYKLYPKYNYRAGFEFTEFLETYRAKEPLNVNYYLLRKEVSGNRGHFQIQAIDANQYSNNKYKGVILSVNKELKDKVENNILYIKTVDSGSYEARVGLGIIKADFKVSAIFVSGYTYRTHPIQIFFNPNISIEIQLILYKFFNFILEYFRKKTDSEFLTTYKYSKAPYTRKYLGLTQARKLIETFPYSSLLPQDIANLKHHISNDNFSDLVDLLTEIKERRK